jgi:hypothetical protein
MTRTPFLLLALALAASPAAALTEEETRGYAAILPMLQEVSPQDGDVLAACVVSTAEPAEKATLAAAPGPSEELGALVSAILARPATIGCVQATLGG